ncbi:hypothetical protein [Thermococcus peptonophilus]
MGIEDVEDLIEDLERGGFRAVRA